MDARWNTHRALDLFLQAGNGGISPNVDNDILAPVERPHEQLHPPCCVYWYRTWHPGTRIFGVGALVVVVAGFCRDS